MIWPVELLLVLISYALSCYQYVIAGAGPSGQNKENQGVMMGGQSLRRQSEELDFRLEGETVSVWRQGDLQNLGLLRWVCALNLSQDCSARLVWFRNTSYSIAIALPVATRDQILFWFIDRKIYKTTFGPSSCRAFEGETSFSIVALPRKPGVVLSLNGWRVKNQFF